MPEQEHRQATMRLRSVVAARLPWMPEQELKQAATRLR
jgi:hypothetical protein